MTHLNYSCNFNSQTQCTQEQFDTMWRYNWIQRPLPSKEVTEYQAKVVDAFCNKLASDKWKSEAIETTARSV